MKIKHNNTDKLLTLYYLDCEKSIQYSVFFDTLLINLEMHDQFDMLNDLLLKTNVHLGDEEILNIMDKPLNYLNYILIILLSSKSIMRKMI